jgi:glyceraldehyde-3-phosphate dehydrogenase/erythrose-4-phosphate dehydrogenase
MSSAAETTAYFFPELKEKLYAKSIRIPIPATTLYDLNIKVRGKYTKEEVNRQIELEISTLYQNILDTVKTQNVSSDYIQNPHSAVIDLPLTMVSGNLLKISAWQDNEYGYAKRLVDMAKVIA